MFFRRPVFLAVAMSLCLLTACQKKEDAPAPTTDAAQSEAQSSPLQSAPVAEEVLEEVSGFAGSFDMDKAMSSQFSHDPSAKYWIWQSARLRSPSDSPGQAWLATFEGQNLAVTPSTFFQIDSIHAVVLGSARTLNDSNQPDYTKNGHESVIAWFFRNDEGMWILDGTPTGVTNNKSDAQLSIKLTRLGDNRSGFVIDAQQTEQQGMLGHITPYAFGVSRTGSGEIQPLIQAPLPASYTTCHENAEQWLDNGHPAFWEPQRSEALDIEAAQSEARIQEQTNIDPSHLKLCQNLQARWRFEKLTDNEFYDLVFDFIDKATLPSNTQIPEFVTQHAPARYRWINGQYELIQGDNIVPTSF